MFFAHLNDEKQENDLFHPAVLLAWLRVLRVFEVGHAARRFPAPSPAHAGPV